MKIKANLALFFFFLFLPIYAEISVSADTTIALSSQEISAFRAKIVNRESVQIDIVIYSFSSAHEIYSLDQTGTLVVKSEPGFIRCMVSLSSPQKKKDIYFIEATGSTREDLLTEAAGKINLSINERQ